MEAATISTESPSVPLTRRQEIALKIAEKKKAEEDNFTFRPKILKNKKSTSRSTSAPTKERKGDEQTSTDGPTSHFDKMYYEGLQKLSQKIQKSISKSPRSTPRSRSSFGSVGPKFGPGPSRTRSLSVGSKEGQSTCRGQGQSSRIPSSDSFNSLDEFTTAETSKSPGGCSHPIARTDSNVIVQVPMKLDPERLKEVAERLNQTATVSSQAKAKFLSQSRTRSESPQMTPERTLSVKPANIVILAPSSSLSGYPTPESPSNFPQIATDLVSDELEDEKRLFPHSNSSGRSSSHSQSNSHSHSHSHSRSCSTDYIGDRLSHAFTASSNAKIRAPSPLVPESLQKAKVRSTPTTPRSGNTCSTLACLSNESAASTLIGLDELDHNGEASPFNAARDSNGNRFVSINRSLTGGSSTDSLQHYAHEVTERLAKKATFSSSKKHITNKPQKGPEELPENIPGTREFSDCNGNLDSASGASYLGSSSDSLGGSVLSITESQYSMQSKHSVLSVTNTTSSAQKHREKLSPAHSIHDRPIQINGASPRGPERLVKGRSSTSSPHRIGRSSSSRLSGSVDPTSISGSVDDYAARHRDVKQASVENNQTNNATWGRVSPPFRGRSPLVPESLRSTPLSHLVPEALLHEDSARVVTPKCTSSQVGNQIDQSEQSESLDPPDSAEVVDDSKKQSNKAEDLNPAHSFRSIEDKQIEIQTTVMKGSADSFDSLGDQFDERSMFSLAKTVTPEASNRVFAAGPPNLACLSFDSNGLGSFSTDVPPPFSLSRNQSKSEVLTNVLIPQVVSLGSSDLSGVDSPVLVETIQEREERVEVDGI